MTPTSSPTAAPAAPALVLRGLHHVAYRCRDAVETAEFYTNVLGLTYAHAVKTDTYKGERCPYLHVFFKMADDSYIAFFELPEHAEMGWDPNTPRWVQHLSLRVDDEAALQEAKRRLEARGIEVDGPRTGHTVRALYFYDPSGNRLELSVPLALDEAACAARAEADLEAWKTERAAYLARRPARAAA
jgi:catechol 2,3-dioxygenase-like lactoylglutathione lyase family enzyme